MKAVDNVLERFVAINETEDLLREEQILRVATDQSKVNPSLQHYTVNARVGGDMNENNRLLKQAQDRVEKAVLIFTTCAGILKLDFDIMLQAHILLLSRCRTRNPTKAGF